jgi:HEAT repeat protein
MTCDSRAVATLAAIFLFFHTCYAQEPAPSQDALIHTLIIQLDDDDFEKREQAQLSLLKKGDEAKGALAEAAKDGSAELKTRAGLLLNILSLSAELRENHPGIQTELLKSYDAWGKYFILLGDKLEYKEKSERQTQDLEVLASGALRNIDTHDVELQQRIVYFIGQFKLSDMARHLIPMLKVTNSAIRAASARALGRLENKEALPELLLLMDDKEAGVRGFACEGVIALGGEGVIPLMLEMLTDNRANVRYCAAAALCDLRAKSAIPALMARLNDDDANVRAVAANALGMLDAREAIPALIKCVNDDGNHGAFYALRELKATEAIPSLIALSEHSVNRIRERAIDTLGCMNTKEVIPALIKQLKSKDADTRRCVLHALSNLKASEALPAIVKLLADENGDVAQAAYDALLRTNAWSEVPGILPLLKHDTPRVRHLASALIVRLQAAEAIPHLVVLLKDDNETTRICAADTLGKLGDKKGVRHPQFTDNPDTHHEPDVAGELRAAQAIPELIKRLRDSSSSVRRSAAVALCRLEARDAVPALKDVVAGDLEKTVRLFASCALACIGEKLDQENLKELLDNDDAWIRLNGSTLLARLKNKDAIIPLEKFAGDEDPFVREAAREALRQLGE